MNNNTKTRNSNMETKFKIEKPTVKVNKASAKTQIKQALNLMKSGIYLF